MQRIPVHIITGYLGAGKTTFLNQVIRQQAATRWMVIENEVGKVNIDSQWVMGTPVDVMELTAGCLCCSLNQQLIDILYQAAKRRHEYDRLIIETTGVADPESLVLPFVASEAIERLFDLQNTICLTDAKHIEAWIAETDEARRQVAFADVVLLNKADLVSPDYLEDLRRQLSNINPQARLFAGQHGDFPVEDVLHTRQLMEEDAVRSLVALPRHHESHVHGVSTFTLTYDRPFHLDSLRHELFRMMKLNRHQIYRIKGIFNVNNYPVQVILQSVRDTIMLSDGILWGDTEKRESNVVFIGKDLNKKAIERIFCRHLL